MKKNVPQCLIPALLTCLLAAALPAEACTRLVYKGNNDHVLTARSMDWSHTIDTNLWLFPRGMYREGAPADHGLRWTSRYGSVIASGFDVSTTDGMNEKGLTANLLWLSESVYPPDSKDKSILSISAWAQYILDNFATVKEAVTALRKSEFIVVSDSFPGAGKYVSLHLSVSDATGDSAIIEYINGKQVISHSPDYSVLTNSPMYSEQIALNNYWKEIDGFSSLPGTSRSADRFTRASFYINHIPGTLTEDETLASVFSIIRNVSAPYRLANRANSDKVTSKAPRSSTRWRTVADQKSKVYFFESVMTPNTFWINLNDIDFSAETGKVKMLELGKKQSNIYAGNAAGLFTEAEPFEFASISYAAEQYEIREK